MDTNQETTILARIANLHDRSLPIRKSSSHTAKDMHELAYSVGRCLATARPVLSIPATKTEVTAAFLILQKESTKLVSCFDDLGNSMLLRQDNDITAMKTISQAVEHQYSLIPEWVEESKEYRDSKYFSRMFSGDLREMEQARFSKDDLSQRYSAELQQQVQMMLVDQKDEIKQWFVEKGYFSSHLSAKTTNKPAMSILHKHDNIPLEIMSMIYDCCDLQSSVNLRQVNSSWYSGFHDINIWKKKLNERNPWLVPNGDISTYSECVLVFVARLKWPSADSIDAIEVPTTTSPSYCVMAEQLEYGEKLPSDFQSMTQHEPGCSSKTSCGYLHTEQSEIVVDLWTLEKSTLSKDHQIIWDDGFYTCIDFQGIEIEVPFEREQLDDADAVIIGPSTITVRTDGEDSVVLPRYDPHINAGILFPCRYPAFLLHLEDVFMYRNWASVVNKNLFTIADFTRKKLLPFAISTPATVKPVASYNGLIWWGLKKRCLMPTFIDLQAPGRVYYNAKKAVIGPHQDLFQQGHGSLKRFVIGSPQRSGLINAAKTVFDLEKGDVTTVSRPDTCDRIGRQVFLGFQNGHFRPKCMSQEDVERTFHQLQTH